MSETAYVGVDAGTTGVLAAAFDAGGRPLAEHYCEYPCLYPAPGWVEQDMETVFAGIATTLRAVTAALRARGARVASLGLSSQRGTFVLLDEARRPLAPAIVWNDARAAQMEAQLARTIPPQRYRALSGMPMSGFWAVSKLMWVREHRPALYGRARWICNGQEYFLYRLGAEGLETDPASQTLSGMLDIGSLSWSDEICAAAGIDTALLPPVGAPGARVGAVSAEAAAQTGLPAGTPLCRGAGDQQCAALGAGVVTPGSAEITMGTSAMMVAHLDHPSQARTASRVYVGGHAVAGKWDMEGGAFAIGSCLRWWRDNFCGGRAGSTYESIVGEAMSAPAGAAGLVFHPFFSGQVTPHYDTRVRGGFYGLTLAHDRAAMARALLEGCACEIRMMGDALDAGLTGGIDRLMVTGGLARSAAFLNLLANVMDRPLTTLAYQECSVLGAAMLGAVGSGECAHAGEAVERFVRPGRVIEPGADRRLYAEVFGLFEDIYLAGAANGLHRRIFDHQDRRADPSEPVAAAAPEQQGH